MDGIQGLRLVTVHPILVHVSLGCLPLIVLAYGLAAWLRSERWTLVADVALTMTAAVTLVTVAFGLVSNALLDWPGGLGVWRWLHLGFGIAVAALLAAFAAGRLILRAHRPVSGGRAFAGAVALSALAGFTGWIGGEVLVYHAGMAVTAAGRGALAPPVTALTHAPDDVLDCMHALRGAWGSATGTLASAIVESPTSADYAALETAAKALDRDASRLAGNGPPPLRSDGAELVRQAADLQSAASAHDITAATRALDGITQSCASCHHEHRWTKGEKSR